MHISRCEGFTVQVRDPSTEIIMTRRDKASPRAVKGMAYGEIDITAVAVFVEVWGI